MPNSKLRRASAAPESECKMDMSPMIDMVFLLIIFFMVASEFVVIRKDPDVTVPIAPDGKAIQSVTGRVLVNIYSDDKMKEKGLDTPFADVNSKPLMFEDITELVRNAREENERNSIAPTVLMLRGDRDALVRRSKEVLTAAGAAGVNDIMFSAFREKR